jgi:hypothetical protein
LIGGHAPLCPPYGRTIHALFIQVIASEAKQSISPPKEKRIAASLRASQ